MSITSDFQAVAVALINRVVPVTNAKWYSIAVAIPSDPNNPWEIPQSSTDPSDVRIFFFSDNKENKRFQEYIPTNDVDMGVIRGLMYKTTFEPKKKDVVLWQGKELTVVHIDETRPVDDTILYDIRFEF